MKRPAVFITYFQSSFQTVHSYQVLQSELQSFTNRFQYNIHFFSSLTTFMRKLMKRPINFMTYFQTSYQYVHAQKILSSENFY